MDFGAVLLDSLIDTLKLVPFLFLVYFLIELLEYKNVFKFEKSNLLKGKASPALGACFGCVPQCGFSVVSAELYSERKISVAALVAVFIATSDEAFPLMISDYHTIPSLLLLIVTKLVLAIAIGYLTYFLSKRIFKDNSQTQINKTKSAHLSHNSITINEKTFSTDSSIDTKLADHKNDNHSDTDTNHDHNEETEHNHIHACCHHDPTDTKFDWKHPLIHCAKISLYIFLVNLIMGIIVALIGEESLMNFLSSSSLFQPLFALIVGIIPNCAASVVLTELYMMGGLSFGAIVTGLSVNAGIGLLVLLKQNKNIKENLFIIFMLVIPSLIAGYALHFIPLDFLRI